MRLSNFKTYYNFLSKNKLYTITTTIGLAVALMFVLLLSVYVKNELSVDSFHEKKDRIFLLAKSGSKAYFANPVADLLKDNLPEVESYTRIMLTSMPGTIGEEEATINTLFADPDFFHIFSFDLLEGKRQDVLSLKNTVVINQSFANKHFSETNPIGKTIRLYSPFGGGDNGVSDYEVTITGIMKDLPTNTQIPDADIIVNYETLNNFIPDLTNQWHNVGFGIYFLAKENADLPSKSSVVVDLLYKNEYADYIWDGWKEAIFMPLSSVYFSQIETASAQINMNSKSLVITYIVITLLILIVAILNYISLSVSQAGKRGKEAAIKKLLGCNKKELVVQFVSESMIMTIVSFLIGVVLVFFSEPFFNDLLSTKLNFGGELLNPQYGIALLISILAIGLISGLIPALVISSFQPLEIVKGTYIRKVKTTYSKVLVVFQYTVAITLLICSIFIIQQTNYMRNYDMGFDKDNILLLQNTIDVQQENSLRSLFETISGVERVSFSQGVPLNGGGNQTFQYNGQSLSFQEFRVDSAFFDIFNIKIVSSTNAQSSEVPIWVNQRGYDALQPDPKTFVFEFRPGMFRQIAGITNDFHFRPLQFENGMTMIRFRDEYSHSDIISVKISKGADLLKTAEGIKTVYSKFNGGKMYDSFFSEEIIERWYQHEEKTAKLLTTFTILTFIILLMGILALSLYYVQQREKEISIRKINGATEKQVIGILNMNFIHSILIAFPIASVIAYYASQKWLESFAYKISLSWWVFALAGAVVVAISALFITMQSWKAANTNPIELLKND